MERTEGLNFLIKILKKQTTKNCIANRVSIGYLLIKLDPTYVNL